MSTFDDFINSLDSYNTTKVVKSLSAIGDYEYSNVTPVDVEQIVLSLKPKSEKAITTILYVMSLYAKFLNNDDMYHMVKDADRKALWIMAKPNAPKKFISNKRFEEIYKDIDLFEEYNSLYIYTLFRCIYEGIYSDDMSVIKNLRSSDVNSNVVILKEDNGYSYELKISDLLAKDLIKLGDVSVWSRNNRYAECKIKTTGLYKDSVFKVEVRGGGTEYSYRYSYYRILRNISKNYVGYNLLPLQLYVSGIMHRIKLNLNEYSIELEEAFAVNNKNRIVNKIISEELERCNCNTEVRNFREIVRGHIDVFNQ